MARKMIKATSEEEEGEEAQEEKAEVVEASLIAL